MWISDAIDKGLIQPSRAAHHSGGPDAATQWLRANSYNIPDEFRPQENDIEEFAAFFSTYLTSSFEVVENPGTTGQGPTPTHCRCGVCMRIVNAPHLRTKKLYARDKRRAKALMRECLSKFADENNIHLNDDLEERILIEQGTRRSAAYITYGHWLIRRLYGESDGPAILAIWRLIAWDPRGGMRQDFTLELSDFKAAETALLAAIQNVN